MEDSSCYPPIDSNQTQPELMVSQGAELDNYTFYSISRDEYFQKSIPEFRNKKVAPTSYFDWVALFDDSTLPINCSLYNTISQEKIELPPIELESLPTFRCILSKPPNDPDCHVLFMPHDHFILFCRIGDDRFVRRSEKFEKEYLVSAANLNGKVYAGMHLFVGTCSFVEVDFVGQEIILKRLVNDKGKPCQIIEPFPKECTYNDYLMESCGELLFVSMYWDLCSMKLKEFKIFKITVLGGEIEELRNIGDQSIFLATDMAVSLLSTMDNNKSKEGCPKKNSIYYHGLVDGDLYIYDIDGQTTNLDLELEQCPTFQGPSSLRCWFMP